MPKRKGSFEIIRNHFDWNLTKKEDFCDSSSYWSQFSESQSETIDEEEVDIMLMKKFKLVRRNSWWCTFWGQEKITQTRRIKEIMVLKQAYLNNDKERILLKQSSSGNTSSSPSKASSIIKSSINVSTWSTNKVEISHESQLQRITSKTPRKVLDLIRIRCSLLGSA